MTNSRIPASSFLTHRIYDTVHIDRGTPQMSYRAFQHPLGTSSKFILDGKVISKPKTLLQTNMDLSGQLYNSFIVNAIILNFKSLRKNTKKDIQRIRESSYFELRLSSIQVICLPLLLMANGYFFDVTYDNMYAGLLIPERTIFEVIINFDTNIKLTYPTDMIVSLVGLKKRPI